MTNKLATIIILLLLTLVISSGASADYTLSSFVPAPALAPFGTTFTYQGYLTDGGSPANGAYDFQFKLYNDASVGTQVGSTETKDDVIASEGIFTVELGFGDVFDGTALWLEVGVRPGASTGGYQQLLPRQPLTATPYALYASHVSWSGVSGIPAGFADNTDDDTTYTAGNQLSMAGTTFNVSEGAASGLDADLLDGQHGSFYRNASNLNAGTLNNARFSARSDLSAEGYLGNASGDIAQNNGTLQSNLNADRLQGASASYLLNASNINSGTLQNNHFSAYSDLSAEGHLGAGIYEMLPYCASGGTLTRDSTCVTLLCNPLPLRYFTCVGSCTAGNPQTCFNYNLGRLVD